MARVPSSINTKIIIRQAWIGTLFGKLMNQDQFVDIINALKQQKSNYSEQELAAALNYYAEHDTFLEL